MSHLTHTNCDWITHTNSDWIMSVSHLCWRVTSQCHEVISLVNESRLMSVGHVSHLWVTSPVNESYRLSMSHVSYPWDIARLYFISLYSLRYLFDTYTLWVCIPCDTYSLGYLFVMSMQTYILSVCFSRREKFLCDTVWYCDTWTLWDCFPCNTYSL